MAQTLVVCGGCARHVKSGTACPFCGAAVASGEAPTVLEPRLHRAAMIGLGAAIALSTACAPSPAPAYGGPPVDVAPADAAADGGGVGPAYGAPAVDGGN